MEIENAVICEWRCVSQALQYTVEVTCVPQVSQPKRPRLPSSGSRGLPRDLQIRQEGKNRHVCCGGGDVGSALLLAGHPT